MKVLLLIPLLALPALGQAQVNARLGARDSAAEQGLRLHVASSRGIQITTALLTGRRTVLAKDWVDMLDQLERVAGERRIRELHIHDHGTPGKQLIGDDSWGVGTDATGQHWGLSVAPGELARLKQLLQPNALLVFHGCRVGQQPKLLELLARDLNVRARAGHALQRVLIPWLIQGTTTECSPRGCETRHSPFQEVLDGDMLSPEAQARLARAGTRVNGLVDLLPHRLLRREKEQSRAQRP